MAVHAVTFRLEHDATYDERYLSVVDAIRQQSTSQYWDEPTSFVLIESAENSAGVAEAIHRNSRLDPGKDLLLVINLSQKGYTPLGIVRDDHLHVLMKKRW